MSGDLLDAKSYTLNGMLDPIQLNKPSANSRRESRFQLSTAPCPLPTYHSELDRNLVNHFQKPGVRATLQSKKFQRMLPGIDHELKMEMNPPLEYPSRFTRGMFNNKQGGNATYAQPVDQNGVRHRVFKDAYYVADVDGRLQPKPLHQEMVREVVRAKSPRRETQSRALMPKRKAPHSSEDQTELSMVSNTAYGIRNETHGSPFMRKLQKNVPGASSKASDSPLRPDSVRSEDIIAQWQTGSRGAAGQHQDQPLSHGKMIEVSRKFPPHMQHHHHYGWGDAHISTSLYKPRNIEARDAKNCTLDQDHALKYIDKVRTTHTSISRCPTSFSAPKKLVGHNVR